jgi:large subunit ribosomal protein L3e
MRSAPLYSLLSSNTVPSEIHENRFASKKKAFTKASKKWTDDLGKKSIEDNFNKMIRYCKVVRLIVHSQVSS